MEWEWDHARPALHVAPQFPRTVCLGARQSLITSKDYTPPARRSDLQLHECKAPTPASQPAAHVVACKFEHAYALQFYCVLGWLRAVHPRLTCNSKTRLMVIPKQRADAYLTCNFFFKKKGCLNLRGLGTCNSSLLLAATVDETMNPWWKSGLIRRQLRSTWLRILFY